MAIPLCRYFGTCGGCSFQHVDIETQLSNKARALASASLINPDIIKVFSGNPYNYRNRMDMIFHPGGIGFREKGNWKRIVDIDKCVISNEKLNLLMSEVRDYFKAVDAFDVKKNTGTYRYAVIRTPQDDSSVSFVLNEDSPKLTLAVENIKQFAEKTTANNIIITYVPSKADMSISEEFFPVKGGVMLKESFLGKEFLYSVQGFFQNNHEMAEKMHEYVNSLIKSHCGSLKHHTLLDLYAGVGTFGIINSEFFKDVLIVESVKPCIDAAEENLKNNKTHNAKAILLDAMQLKKLELTKIKDLFLITDPPRSGMNPKTIDEINSIRPKNIIYISCNVEQLAKDIPKFKGYAVKSAALFDLFPQTPHSEAVVELVLV